MGEIDIEYITEAVPEILTITGLPSCGVLIKAGVTAEEQTFGMFWEYTVEQEFTMEIGIGDQVNLSNESVIFTDSDDCETLATSFSYIVDANMPVGGPSTYATVR